MQEQLSRPLRLMVGVGAMMVRRDVAADQPGLAVVDEGIAILEVDLGFPERLHLGPAERQPGLVGLENREVVESLPVGGDDLVTRHRVDHAPLTSLAASVMMRALPGPKWRNWQTRMIQGHVPARVWGFESPLRHHRSLSGRAVQCTRSDRTSARVFREYEYGW